MGTLQEAPIKCRVLTPRGVGALAVLRISGRGCWELVRHRIRSSARQLPLMPVAGHLYFGAYHDGAEQIDEVIVGHFTPQDGRTRWVDLSCHGSVRIVERILLSVTADGAVLQADGRDGHRAWPGRNLIQRRAWHLLARTTTRRAAMFLMAQAQLLPAELKSIAKLARSGRLAVARSSLDALVERSRGAHYLTWPADVAVVGPPNAGKSLLANRLAGIDAAIVAEQAGTTRDWVSLGTAIDGVPITLIDTAGAHATDDEMEREAIRAGRERTAAADLFLVVFDVAKGPQVEAQREWLGRIGPDRAIIVRNKIDLGEVCPGEQRQAAGAATSIRASALTGDGLGRIRAEILSRLGLEHVDPHQPAIFDRELLDELARLAQDRTASGKSLANRLRNLLADA